MKVLADINVLMDVLEEREQHYSASAAFLSLAECDEFEIVVAGHALPTIYFLIKRSAGHDVAMVGVRWVLDLFEVVTIDGPVYEAAYASEVRDYEDAIVAACAVRAGCDRIVTRNVSDFRHAEVSATTPIQFLEDQ